MMVAFSMIPAFASGSAIFSQAPKTVDEISGLLDNWGKN